MRPLATGLTAAGLYLHVPFCRSICPYCDFSVTLAGEPRRQGWERAVIAEAGHRSVLGWRFDTVYLGGGTPSNLGAERLGRVVEAVRRHLDVAPGAQWVLEANPEDVTENAARSWRTLGFGGVSIGVQAFGEERLRRLGRQHDPEAARLAVERARGAGFGWVSLDLMFGVVGDDPGSWRCELEQAVALGPDHISCYQLTVHEGTPLGRRVDRGETLGVVPEELQADLYADTQRLLAGAGFEAYEVSSFARPGHRSRHNQRYWRHEPYLGLGPSAHSFDGRRRWWNLRRVRLWQRQVEERGDGVEDGEELSVGQLAFEKVMLGLRTRDGVDLGRIGRMVGEDLVACNRRTLARLERDGLVELGGEWVRPTPRGLAVADTLVRSLDLPGID